MLVLPFLAAVPCHAQGFTNAGWFHAQSPRDPAPVPGPRTLSAAEVNTTPGPCVAEFSTPQIQALARGLENDPLRIFNYVHDRIRHVLYFGSKKGAQVTLLEKSGNDFDQSALLVALLRAAGYADAGYQFGWMKVPYDSQDGSGRDLRHWLGITMPNTNWFYTTNYLFDLFYEERGYPIIWFDNTDTNTVWFQRVWVTLPIGGTNYYLDPAFKLASTNSGIDLSNAMRLVTTDLLSAAGGTGNSNFVQSLSEANLRNKLRDYTTNLLFYVQTNSPNASVQEVLGGQQVTPSTATALPQTLYFPRSDFSNSMPILNWVYEPTNLMSIFSMKFAGTNYTWFVPQLSGLRISLTFSTNGLAQLWQDDTNLLEHTTSASDTNIILSVDHPIGCWDVVHNVLINSAYDDQTATTACQRTNSFYALVYGFEPDIGWLQQRQRQLDMYRQSGLADNSREVVSESLNVMGLNYLLQTKWVEDLLAAQLGILPQQIHQFGFVGQERSRGYFIDISMEISGELQNGGFAPVDVDRSEREFELTGYFDSALEHGVIEQLQSSNLVAASTVKMLQLANTNGLKLFLANDANWWSTTSANIRGQVVNYDLARLDTLINEGLWVFLPQNGAIAVGNWTGSGYLDRFFDANGSLLDFVISGSYHGGYEGDPSATVDPYYIDVTGYLQPQFWTLAPAQVQSQTGLDPVDMADGTFRIETSDLSLAASEPRGLNFTRYYSSGRRNSNLAGMAHGWIHNYLINVAEISAPHAGLGGSTPQQMAPMLVATRAAIGVLNYTNQDPKNWTVTALIAKWGVDQLTRNAVSVALGKDNIQFVKQPNGVFTPPAGSTMTLIKTNSAYQLQERHGNTFKFNSVGFATNIVDQYNRVLKISYQASNWVSSVTDWTNRSLTFTYSGTPQRLTSVSDNTGRSVSYGYSTAYSPQGDLSSFTDAEGQTSTFLYDTNHQLTATLDALSRVVVSNMFGLFGRVTTQYTQGDPGKTWNLFWSGFANVEQDPAGSRRIFYYDEKGRQTGIQDALGNLSQRYYDGQDHSVMTVSPMNETNQYIFDGNHNLLYAIDSLGFTNQFIYDAQFNLTSTIDPRGNTNKFGYNSKFQLIGQTNGAGDWVTFGYNSSDGTLANKADAGGTTTFGNDGWGQLAVITYPASLGSEGFLNNALGDTLGHTNGRGFVTSFSFNKRRQLTSTTAPTNLITSIGYDAVGNVTTNIDARTNKTFSTWSTTRKLSGTALPSTPQGVPVLTNFYDARDWLYQSLNPLQQATVYINDAAGRAAGMTDPLQRTTSYGFDADGRRISSTNAALEVSQQVLDARGEALLSVDGANNKVSRVFDGAGSQTVLTNRNGKVWQFQFDKANRLTNTITPTSRQTKLAFNNRGLLKSITQPSTKATSFDYDALKRLTNRTDLVGSTVYQLDKNGNTTNVLEGSATIQRTFDAYDRLTSYKDADGNLVQYRTDQNGNVTNLVYPGGKNVYYAFDSLNRMTNVTDWANRKTSLTWDLASRLKTITRPNGTVREMTYDDAGELTNIVERTGANLPIAFFKLHFNAAVRIDWEFEAPLPHSYTPPTRTMTFDDDNRLLTFNSVNVSNDTDGNLTYGPLTNGTFYTYTYDARNRLLSAGGLSYGYDAAGNRTSITNGTNITRFVINPNHALSQVLMRVKNGVTNYYVYGMGLLYEADDAGNTKTYHYDYRGSTLAVTDGGGNVTDRFEYSAYGLISYRTGTTDTPFLFNGRYGVMTDANGLLFMRSRYYNPYLCRFINPDPSGFAGGLNWYAYADGNPISLMDPFGLGTLEVGYSWVGGNSAPSSVTGRGTFNPYVLGNWAYQSFSGPPIDFSSIPPESAPVTVPWTGASLQAPEPNPFVSDALTVGSPWEPNSAMGRRFAEGNAVNMLTAPAFGILGDLFGPSVATAESAQNVMNGVRLSEQLTLESANSAFTATGELSPGAIANATRIIRPGALANPAIPSGFGKFTTQTFSSPSGPFQVHFYMNPTTGEVFTGLDYKVVFNAGH